MINVGLRVGAVYKIYENRSNTSNFKAAQFQTSMISVDKTISFLIIIVTKLVISMFGLKFIITNTKHPR